MKTLRIWLLMVLAALLPIRGAVGAAMLCPPTAAGSQSEQHWHDRSLDRALAAAVDHEHMQHDHGMSGTDEHRADATPGGTADKCSLCCDYCSFTPLVSTVPTVPMPQDLSAVSFPDISAPAPSFISDGQERPPRSL